MDNQQGHRELCSMLCGRLAGRGVWGRMDTCIYMTESETITTLLIGYTPKQNKEFTNCQSNKPYVAFKRKVSNF